MKRAIFKNGDGQIYIVNLKNVAFYEVGVWSSENIYIKFVFVDSNKMVFLCKDCESLENIHERFSQTITFIRRVKEWEK